MATSKNRCCALFSFFSLALGFASCASRTISYPPLGTDEPYEGEDADIAESVRVITELQRKIHHENQQSGSDQERTKHRGAHAKGLGCLTGDVAVLPNASSDARVGIFSQTTTDFKAMVRFSNASPRVFDGDSKDEPRGMTLRIYGAQGTKLFGDPNARQVDFLLTSLPIFPAQTVADYNQLATNRAWYLLTHLRTALRVKSLLPTDVNNVFALNYHTMGALKWGNNAAKLRMKSCQPKDDLGESGRRQDEQNFLFNNLSKSAKEKDHCFTLEVQLQKDPVKQPVEDATILWQEEDTPFLPLARVTLQKQDISQLTTQCEAMEFNPWRTTAEHRPLGSLNRARKAVYEATAKFRSK